MMNQPIRSEAPSKRSTHEECELLSTCGFFKKYRDIKDLACRGFIRMYCRGPRMQECKRKQYRAKHGVPPPDEMLPSGQPIAGSAGERDEMAASGVE